jgi:hypothetical protein
VYTGTLPDVRDLNNLEGQYRGVLLEHHGFMQLMAALPSSNDVIAVVDENTVSLGGTEFSQIRPFVFRADSEPLALHLKVENNEVTRVLLVSDTAAVVTAGPVMEYTPISGLRVFASGLSIILFVACIIFLFVAIILIGVGARRNRKKGVPSNIVKKLNTVLIISGIAVIANYFLMLVRVGFLTPKSMLIPHFIFNIAYIVFVPVCIIFISINLKKVELTKGGRLFCMLSCIISIVLAALMVLWEFYR